MTANPKQIPELRVPDRLSWSERIYHHNRRKLRWAIPFVALIEAVDLWTLYRAATRHVIYGRNEGGVRGHIWLAEDPTRFWTTVGIHTVALIGVALIPIWLVLGWRAAKARAISAKSADPSGRSDGV